MTKVNRCTTWAVLLVFAATIGCGPSKPNNAEKKSGEEKKSEQTEKKSGDEKKSAQTEKKSKQAGTPDAGKQSGSDGKVMLGSDELFTGIAGDGDLTDQQIQAWLDDPKNHETLDYELPLGLSAGKVVGLDENPLTRAKIELGRQLYFDTRLSKDNTISCATCHIPEHGYAASTQFGHGIKDKDGNPQIGDRNSPVAYNRILSGPQFWDGRAATLEAQAVGPIANPIEMGNTHEDAVKTLEGISGYKMQFDKIFGETTIEAVGKAIASFERAVVTGPTPFDYYEQFKKYSAFDAEDIAEWEEDDPKQFAAYQAAKKAAEENKMSESAIRGHKLFFTQKANCSACHVGANLTDELYHNIGIGMDNAEKHLGRFSETKMDKDRGAFKTPTIRNVAQTPPYMHDGSLKTLEEVVDVYAKGGHANDHLSDKIKKLELSDQDKKDLVEFMKAVTGSLPKVESGRLPKSE